MSIFGSKSCSMGLGSLVRRKQVDSVNVRTQGLQRLAQRLSIFDLIAIGVGSTIGAGVYILVGTVAREHAGPALTVSFLIAGVAAALSGFCYAELACRCPSAGSAYHYTYICIGEGVAWLIGWALILEYTIGGSAVARGISPNLVLFFGGEENLPALLARYSIPGTSIVVDPCAAALVIVLTVLLCIGIKESSVAQTIVTTINVCAMLFIITAGGYIGFVTGWPGYELPSGYFSFGVNGMLAGSGVLFFSYIGFDSVTSTAEEVKNPQRDLPLGIGIALLICCTLYMLVSIVIVGIVPYNELNADTPITSAFASYGAHWAAYVLTTGAVTALCSSLLGSLIPQPRILMAMSRDGLLPPFFSDINQRTQVPVKSTVVTGILATTLAFFFDVSQLAGMVSVGTLLAFTTVAISLLIVRYIPPDEVPLPSSLQKTLNTPNHPLNDSFEVDNQSLLDKREMSIPLIISIARTSAEGREVKRRKIASWSITCVCVGILILSYSASADNLPSMIRFPLCTLGGVATLGSLMVLAYIDQDDSRHSFGHTGGFICPFVPFLPVACILINTYLLVNLGFGTWMSVSVWLWIGILVYVFYGRRHSSLIGAVYIPTSYFNDINRTFSSSSSSSSHALLPSSLPFVTLNPKQLLC